MSTRPGEEHAGALCTDTGRKMVIADFPTSWGDGAVAVAHGRLIGVELPPVRIVDQTALVGIGTEEDVAALDRWVAELTSYFRGEKLSWEVGEVEFHLDDLGPFARSTVSALMGIPNGDTVSYGELAELAGHPKAARAVGTVMASNPIPIVVPCHRVIRSDGSLGRYGSDATWKERLLSHERRSGGHG